MRLWHDSYDERCVGRLFNSTCACVSMFVFVNQIFSPVVFQFSNVSVVFSVKTFSVFVAFLFS